MGKLFISLLTGSCIERLLVNNLMDRHSYHSYLLRVWQEDTGQKTTLRFVLVNLNEDEQWGFASLEQLFAFLKKRVNEGLSPALTDRE